MDEVNVNLGATSSVESNSKFSERHGRGTERAKASEQNFSALMQKESSFLRNAQSNKESSKTTLPNHNQAPLSVHDRSEEIGRFIFTGPQASLPEQTGIMESLNDSGSQVLTDFFNKDDDASSRLIEYIRATMTGKAEAAGPLDAPPEVTTSPVLSARAELSDSAKLGASENIQKDEPFSTTVNGRHGRFAQPELNAGLRDSFEQSPNQSKEAATSALNSVSEHKATKISEFLQSSDRLTEDTDKTGQHSGQRSPEESNSNSREQNESGLKNTTSEQESRQQERWRNRLAELVEEKISIAIKEGIWSVKLNLQSIGLEGIDVALHSVGGAIRGEIFTKDPEVREMLVKSLGKLEKELSLALADQDYQSIEINIADGVESLAVGIDEPSLEVAVSSSEFLSLVPNKPKSGEGLDIFV